MKKPLSLCLSIPTPCHEDWEKMTPNERGRFCAHCQKTVVDFTKWTDTALYDFFSKQTAHVCGRFAEHQLDHEIKIPLQPHSRLYKIFVGLGLTLIFTQLPKSEAKIRPHYSLNIFSPDSSNKEQGNHAVNDFIGTIKGRVLDPKGNPVPYVPVLITQNGVTKNGVITNDSGEYIIGTLLPGQYDVTARALEFGTQTVANVVVKNSTIETVNMKFNQINEYNGLISVGIVYRPPLIDSFQTPHATYSHSQIEHIAR